MAKKRIQVYADPETKRRIELAAAKHEVAVTQYCLEAIRERLAEEDLLQQEKIEIPIKPSSSRNLIPDLRALHERILARRGGELIDVDRALQETRDERDDELVSMR